MLKAILIVGLGGGIGSILRYLASVVSEKYFHSTFPWATFAVNIVGCLLVGMLWGYFAKQQFDDSAVKLLFITGFCGGFTTFSAFALENVKMVQSGNTAGMLVYVLSSILIGLLAVWTGLAITK